MHCWEDNSGRTWDVDLTVGACKRLRGHSKRLDPLQNWGQNLLIAAEDPFLTATCLYLICKPQADRLGMTSEQFGDLFDAGNWLIAAGVLREEASDFFPSSLAAGLRTAQQMSRKKTQAKSNAPATAAG